MDADKIIEIINKFRGKRIAVVGDLMLDIYLFGRVNRVNHERPGYPLLTIEREEYRLGGAGNVAANLASLGADVSLFGALGNDIHGSLFKKRCKRRRINLIPIIDGKTLIKQRRIEIVHNDYLGREDFGEAKLERLTNKKEKKIFEEIIKEKPDVLVLTDYNKKIFKGELGRDLTDWANKNNILTVVDPKPQNINSFKNAGLISPNLREAKEILGREYENKPLEEFVRSLKEFVGSRYVAVTCGAEGIASFNGKFHRFPTEVKELADVTGAGDTVTAALALSMAAGADLPEATFIANHAAGIVVEKLGTASVTQRQLVEEIRKVRNPM